MGTDIMAIHETAEGDNHKADETTEDGDNHSHFIDDPIFMDQVEVVLAELCGTDWAVPSLSLRCLTSSFERNVRVCTNAVNAIINNCNEFKIGITVNAIARWKLYGGKFTRMYILYFATSSKPWHEGSTGKMEQRLIHIFRNKSGCLNTGDGGECPSFGSPHLCYVVTRD